MREARTAEVAIVGAGVIGLAHAYWAASRGHSVVVFERTPKSMGASVRNFGMIWPIGQRAGEIHQMAMRSSAIWTEVLKGARLPYRPTGSLHVVYQPDEADVAREFCERAPAQGYSCQWLSQRQTLAKSDALIAEGLIGAIWSDTELTVDPRQVIAKLPRYLTEKFSVQFRFGTAVRSIQLPKIEAGGETWNVDHAIVCSGDDFETLYPELLAQSGITRCKLQMMRTAPQPRGWELGPSLAAGLTLRFYPAFEICTESLPRYKARIAKEMPDYERWAIHVLVSQTADGALTLGDSHEYGLAVDVFNKEEIDRLILGNVRTFLRAPDLSIAERWYGVYAKHPEAAYVSIDAAPGVRIVTAPGGSGMTLSFGLAEKMIHEMGL
ncbi:MAG: TIGR03364 family FAD-dependent oxidoreductase [Candidatus Binataceae bacterium]